MQSSPPPPAPVTCPVCGRELGSSAALLSESAIDSHISRCLRQSSNKVNSAFGAYSSEEEGEKRFPLHEDDGSASSMWSADEDDEDQEDDMLSVEEEEGGALGSTVPIPIRRGGSSDIGGRKRGRPAGGGSGSGRRKRRGPASAHVVTIHDDLDGSEYCRRLRVVRGVEEAAVVGAGEGPTEMFQTDFGSLVRRRTWDLLYEHQRRGCEWMWSLYTDKCGGILADEMGLGKTAQTCVHFEAVCNDCLKTSRVSRSTPVFLVVCPATVLRHWARELNTWAPEMRACVFHSISRHFAEVSSLGISGIHREVRRLSQAKESPHGLVLIVTYEGLRNMRQALITVDWDGICVDEGQKIRNPSAEITSVCKLLSGYHRVLLSGTPIQNSLLELWSLFDFCYPGKLGTPISFEADFSDPIKAGSYAGSSKHKVEIAFRTAQRLQRIIQPYLLRRRKNDASVALILPDKKEQVLFCRLSKTQRSIYESICSSPEVERAIRLRRPLFGVIITLRKLCNHPLMAFHKGRIKWHYDSDDNGDGSTARSAAEDGETAIQATVSSTLSGETGSHIGTATKPHLFLASDIKWEDSGKLLVLSQILPVWKQEGHKVLLFSQTQSMLNICEALIKQLGFPYHRLDGSTPIGRRDGLINAFNSPDSEIFVMLLTTRAGGLGISLTGANRVIILDPDWNPQTDIQARERAWRIGQDKNVTVYRLVTKGTIEEKIYKKQISKLLLSEKILLNARQQRMPFSKSEVRDMFELGDDDCGDAGSISFHGQPISMSIADDQLVLSGRGSDIICGSSTNISAVTVDPIESSISVEPPAHSNGHDNVSLKTIVLPTIPPDSINAAHPRTAPTPHYSSEVSAVSAEQRVESRLVSSLFNCENISGVFDYDSALAQSSSGKNMFSENSRSYLRTKYETSASHGEFSGTASRELLNNFKGMSSTDSEIGPDRDIHTYRVVHEEHSGARSGRHMKSLPGVVGGRGGEREQTGTPASVVPRLKKLFGKPNVKFSTVELLEKFRDLDDQYAQLFRELLRTVAVFDSALKVWKKRR